MDPHDASVLLTGGSRGIGPHIARALIARGARVILAARSKDDLEKVRASLPADRVAIAPGDVTDAHDRKEILAAARDTFGPIDVLVNNAGTEKMVALTDHRAEDVSDIVRLNLEATIELTRQVLPEMLERRRGHVVMMSSLSGKAATPYNTVYAATKWGLVGFSYSLRAELHGTGVSASVVCPGFVLEDGMFARNGTTEVPRASGTATTPTKVADAVVRAIERDRPDVVVSGPLPKISDVAYAISPALSDGIARRTGAHAVLAREARVRSRGR